MEITSRPYQYCFSKNKIEYQFNVELPDAAGCLVDIQLFKGKDEVPWDTSYLYSFLIENPNTSELHPERGRVDLIIKAVKPNVTYNVKIKQLSDDSIITMATYTTTDTSTIDDVIDSIKTQLLTAVPLVGMISIMGNEMTFFFDNANYTLLNEHIEVIDNNDPEIGVKVFDITVKPDTSGNCAIDLKDIIDSLISFSVPSGTNIIKAENFDYFYIKYRRITDAITDAEYITSEVDHIITVIKGGVTNLAYLLSDDNYFITKYSNVKLQPFCTWQPDKTFVGAKDKFWISWMCLLMGDNPSKGLRIRWYDKNGVETVIDKAIPNDGADVLYHIPAGPQQLGIPTNNLWYYTLRVEYLDGDDTPDSAFSPTYTFYLDYRTFYNAKLFNYYNSLGGIDHVRILGEEEESFSRDLVESEIFVGEVDAGIPVSSIDQSNFTTAYSYKTDVGYRHTKAEIEALKEIFTSKMIWQYYFDKLLRIHLLNKSGKITGTDSKRFNMPIEYKYGFVDSVYTPLSYLQ